MTKLQAMETLLTHAKSLLVALQDHVGLIEKFLESEKVRLSSVCIHPYDKISFNRNEVESVYTCRACGKDLDDNEIDIFLDWDKQQREDRRLNATYNRI